MTTIWVTGQYEALHRWPKAVGKVLFLKNNHRHIFYYKVEVEVSDLDRQIEFLEFKKEIAYFCDKTFCRRPTTYSCEQMCELIRRRINSDLDVGINKIVSVTVSEDGENGATWHRD